MADDLNGKVAIVTGGARDIGRAISMKFGALGASVVVNYNDSSEEAEKTLKDLEAIGAKAIAIQADVSKEEGVSNLLEKATEKLGKSIDILVNNAGGNGRIAVGQSDGDQSKKRIFNVQSDNSIS